MPSFFKKIFGREENEPIHGSFDFVDSTGEEPKVQEKKPVRRQSLFRVEDSSRLLSLINLLGLTIFCAATTLYLIKKGGEATEEIDALTRPMGEQTSVRERLERGDLDIYEKDNKENNQSTSTETLP